MLRYRKSFERMVVSEMKVVVCGNLVGAVVDVDISLRSLGRPS